MFVPYPLSMTLYSRIKIYTIFLKKGNVVNTIATRSVNIIEKQEPLHKIDKLFVILISCLKRIIF